MSTPHRDNKNKDQFISVPGIGARMKQGTMPDQPQDNRDLAAKMHQGRIGPNSGPNSGGTPASLWSRMKQGSK